MIPPTLRLSTFYQDIHNWITTGESPIPFKSTYGLCSNLRAWIAHHNGTQWDHTYLQECLLDEFLDARRCPEFPFNSGDSEAYTYEQFNNLSYQNPERLEWILTHATKVGV